jgi:AcrR family transcriptional regulator
MTGTRKNLRDEIVATGARILGEFGFGRLTQPQVSKELGITQSRLTYYFPKRADLLIGVVDHATRIIANEVSERIAEGVSALSSRRLFSLVSWIVRDRKRTQLVLNIFFESQESPELRKRIQGMVRSHRKLIGSAIGRPEGHPDAAIVMAAVWGLSLQHYILGEELGDAESERILKRFEQWVKKETTS